MKFTISSSKFSDTSSETIVADDLSETDAQSALTFIRASHGAAAVAVTQPAPVISPSMVSSQPAPVISPSMVSSQPASGGLADPKPKRTPKKTTPAVDPVQQEIPVTSVAPTTPVPTEDAVVAAVKQLAAAKGVPAVHTVFATFGIKRASEIKPEQRAAFLAEVAKVG